MTSNSILLIIWFITASILIITITNRSSNPVKSSAANSIMVSSSQTFLDRSILGIITVFLVITLILSH